MGVLEKIHSGDESNWTGKYQALHSSAQCTCNNCCMMSCLGPALWNILIISHLIWEMQSYTWCTGRHAHTHKHSMQSHTITNIMHTQRYTIAHTQVCTHRYTTHRTQVHTHTHMHTYRDRYAYIDMPRHTQVNTHKLAHKTQVRTHTHTHIRIKNDFVSCFIVSVLPVTEQSVWIYISGASQLLYTDNTPTAMNNNSNGSTTPHSSSTPARHFHDSRLQISDGTSAGVGSAHEAHCQEGETGLSEAMVVDSIDVSAVFPLLPAFCGAV